MFDIAITEYVLGDEGLAGTTLETQFTVTYVYIPSVTQYAILEELIEEREAEILVEEEIDEEDYIEEVEFEDLEDLYEVEEAFEASVFRWTPPERT